jgi:hypothetical protein
MAKRGEVPTLTARVVAERLGITIQRVYVLAGSRGLGRRVGRYWLFAESELEAMQERPTGRPKKRPGRPKKQPGTTKEQGT